MPPNKPPIKPTPKEDSFEIEVQSDYSDGGRRKTLHLENHALSSEKDLDLYWKHRQTYALNSAGKTNGFVPARATATENHHHKQPDEGLYTQ